MVAYNPTGGEVTFCKLIDAESLFNYRIYAEAFWEVYMAMDKTSNIVVGVTVTGDTYQLSPAPYKKYIKEDANSMQYIDRSKFLSAVAKYQTKHNLWSRDYD